MTRNRSSDAEESATNGERTRDSAQQRSRGHGSEPYAGETAQRTVDRPAEGRRTDPSGSVGRRDYLRALGGSGAAGIVGSLASTSATAQGTFDEAAADQRIRENQTGPLTVEVVDENDTPVSGADVSVEMQEHDFVWGAEVTAELLVNQYSEGDPYIDHFLDLFNTAVLENIHKWAIWEGNQGLADEAVDWLDERGYRIRGHTCIYSVDYAIPDRVQTAMNNGNGEAVRQETMDHLREIITHYGDQIMEWDVVNEIVHEPELVEAIEGSGVTAHQSSTLADWYAEAESVIEQNGLDVEIVTNDYNTLTWDPDQYYDQVQHLVDQDVGLDALCHQAHIGPSPPDGTEWSYASINEMFEFYADLGTKQRITECDLAGDDWTGHEQRARVLERFLKTAYGHPDFDEFTFWGFWDGAHWLDEAPFFEEDWSEKPALDVYRNLVFDEWWTSESGQTDGSGTYVVDAFLGEHEVTVSTSEGSATRTVSVTDPTGGQQVTVSVEGDGGESPAEPPAVSAVELNGTYRIESVNSGHVLSIEDGSTADEASVVQRSYAGEPDQHWAVEHLGDGVHRIENAASGSSLDVSEGEVADGANVVQWPWHGGDSQRFLVGADDDGDLAIVAQHSNRVLDVYDMSTAEGANVLQWTDNGGDHQRWTFESVDGEQGPPPIGDSANPPADLNGDGLYRDVDGDGDVDHDDVTAFFEYLEDDAVRNNADAFDFDENDRIGFGDVIELLRDI